MLRFAWPCNAVGAVYSESWANTLKPTCDKQMALPRNISELFLRYLACPDCFFPRLKSFWDWTRCLFNVNTVPGGSDCYSVAPRRICKCPQSGLIIRCIRLTNPWDTCAPRPAWQRRSYTDLEKLVLYVSRRRFAEKERSARHCTYLLFTRTAIKQCQVLKSVTSMCFQLLVL